MDCHIWVIDCTLFLRSAVRSLTNRGKNYTLSPIRWEALSSFLLTAFPKDAGDQTVPIDVADSCVNYTMKPFVCIDYSARIESGESRVDALPCSALLHIGQDINSSPPVLA